MCSIDSKAETVNGDVSQYRQESDALGTVAVPASAYWGVHTGRAVANFPLSGRAVRPQLVRALALVKLACCRANEELGYLPQTEAQAIAEACREVAEGGLVEAFVVDALQGGAGTSTNMNVNEVVANRAEQLLGGRLGEYARIDPLRHVNLHQSTNDVYPTAVRVAAMFLLKDMEQAIATLQTAFQEKELAFRHILKVGRTQLQDAVPVTLGMECSAWAESLSRDRWRVFKCAERLRVVNLGGTAVGTGITAPRSYIFLVVEKLREVTGLGLSRAENLMDATQNCDPLVEVSGILKAHAVNLFKITSDLRLLASGPRAGIGELRLPAVQAGSSIMPGKVNPVICEAAAQAALRVMANDSAVTQAAFLGQLELNAFMPLLADSLLGSLLLLTQACRMLAEKCVQGLEADEAACARHLGNSLVTVTALVPALGYECAGEIAAQAHSTGQSVRTVVLERGLLEEHELDRLLSAEAATALGHR
ncbi:aspartate ammonia-lyase [Desulfovibrio desulfuricans]|uniref:Aspartate ammonia-lyase n=1 Tax=Desulfovibrio desulfuricans TaxID=876 RepID=A0A4P7UJE3_DESDE|nr:aspartate ammonia-lyase [Desulfovibrio desulfuricans]QCC85797.1 aspartate ammonia-lyase [Desulfovibrio desulfuricans]